MGCSRWLLRWPPELPAKHRKKPRISQSSCRTSRDINALRAAASLRSKNLDNSIASLAVCAEAYASAAAASNNFRSSCSAFVGGPDVLASAETLASRQKLKAPRI